MGLKSVTKRGIDFLKKRRAFGAHPFDLVGGLDEKGCEGSCVAWLEDVVGNFG